MRPALIRPLTARPAASLARASIPSSTARFSIFSWPAKQPSETTTKPSETSKARKAPAASTEFTNNKTYLVERLPSGLLPVYKQTKAAGQSKFTKIRHIVGDKRAFVNDLSEGLGIPRKEIRLNPTTGNVRVNGFRQEEVKQWLDASGAAEKKKEWTWL